MEFFSDYRLTNRTDIKILQRDRKAASMVVLWKIYGFGMNDRQYHYNLKQKLKERFQD